MDKLDIYVERFLKRKTVVKIIGNNFIPNNLQITRLKKLFYKFGSPRKIENMLSTVAIFLKYDLTNYAGRYRRLKGIGGTSVYTQYLRYGKFSKEILKLQNTNKTKSFTNKIDFWIKNGYTQEEAKLKISKIQKERSDKSVEKMKNTSEYTCRSVTFWIKKGYTLEDAYKKVKEIQTTNGVQYFLSKGITLEDAKVLQDNRTNKWLSSLNKYDQNILNLKKGHSIEAYIARGFNAEDALKRSIEYYKKRKNYSIISQELFEKITEELGIEDIYYKDINYEFQINGKCVDFFYKKKGIVIEFYGDFWHANPKIYQSTDIIYNKTAESIWKLDDERIKLISENSLVKKVIIVWESDYRKNSNKCVRKILEEIYNVK